MPLIGLRLPAPSKTNPEMGPRIWPAAIKGQKTKLARRDLSLELMRQRPPMVTGPGVMVIVAGLRVTSTMAIIAPPAIPPIMATFFQLSPRIPPEPDFF